MNVGYRVVDLKYRSGDEEKVITAAVWYPTAAAPEKHIYGGRVKGNVAPDAEPYAAGGPYPLLVFSHGYGGGGISSVFFTERLAARGWIVVAPDHNDDQAAVRIRAGRVAEQSGRELMLGAKKIAASGPEDRGKYLCRLDELKVVLDGISAAAPFGKLIDVKKIAVGGHSLGGFTALGLCGTIKERLDGRIKAVLLFSTGASGYLFKESELAAVKLPSMYFLGEKEKTQKRGKSDMAELADKVYKIFPPPKFLLEIKGANHFSFNDCYGGRLACRTFGGSEKQFEAIRAYSIAFLEKYVAGRTGDAAPARKDPQVTRYVPEP